MLGAVGIVIRHYVSAFGAGRSVNLILTEYSLDVSLIYGVGKAAHGSRTRGNVGRSVVDTLHKAEST